MGGKGSGNKMVAKNQAWKKSPVIGDNGITATKEEISKITAHALEIALWDEIDTKDPEQLRDRTLKYLQYCIDNNIIIIWSSCQIYVWQKQTFTQFTFPICYI